MGWQIGKAWNWKRTGKGDITELEKGTSLIFYFPFPVYAERTP
jgi:hypothetical protein